MLRQHILIFGSVQGVGFRFFAMWNARQFGIRGWIRNRADGSVEIDAEGSEADLAHFTDAMKQGPEYAVVKSVEIENMTHFQNYTSFTIDLNG